MKRTVFILSLFMAMTMQSQILNVTSIDNLHVTNQNKDVTLQAVAISPQGDYLVLSTDTKQGLVKWDLKQSTATTITEEPGSGSRVLITDDGQQIVYSEVSFKNKLRHEAVKLVNLKTGKKSTLAKPVRDLHGFNVQHGTVAIVSDRETKLRAFNGKAAVTRPILTTHHLKMYLTEDGKTTLFAPNGAEENYIWASLSPNGNRVLYYVSGHGTFVCDTDGSYIISMGNLTAPKWWDDNTIVGMDELDDEYTIVASSIVARTLDGQEQVLTGDDIIATYPIPSSKTGQIAFSTPSGEVYLISVE